MIDSKIKIRELLEKYPDTFDFLVSKGFNYKSSDELLEKVGNITSLSTILKVKNINENLFLKELDEFILADNEGVLVEKHEDGMELDFLGGTICPILSTFKEELEETVRNYRDKSGKTLKCYLQEGKEENDIFEKLAREKDISKFPSVLMTSRIDLFLSDETFRNLIDKEYFVSCWNEGVNKDFISSGAKDPKSQIDLYASALDMFLIDEKKLDGLPVPKTWDNLLDPMYKDKIVVFAFVDGINKNSKYDDISHYPHLYYYKKHGEEGVRKFARNVVDGYHGAKMAKKAGSGSSDAGAINIISRIFANTCVNPNTRVIWPEDGAMIMPLLVFVRKDKVNEVKPLIDFIYGKEFGQKCADTLTPSLNPQVDNRLPEGSELSWLGWDFIRNNDLEFLSKHVREVFLDEWKNK